MSATLCQRAQPQFSPRVVGHDPWGIPLPDLGGWSFLQSLSTPKQNHQNENDDKVYVHPLTEKAKATLSEKSLEMCTESLGSETGSVVSELEDDLTLPVSRSCSRTTLSRYSAKKGGGKLTDLPPPLSTIVRSGGSYFGVQVRSVREDGRLVLKAVSVAAKPTTRFEAERSDGTLKLRMVRGQNEAFQVSRDEDDDDDDDDDCCGNDNEYDDYDDDDDDDDDEIKLDSFGSSSRCKDEEDRRSETRNWEAIWVSA